MTLLPFCEWHADTSGSIALSLESQFSVADRRVDPRLDTHIGWWLSLLLFYGLAWPGEADGLRTAETRLFGI
jgi:hypothetical protein